VGILILACRPKEDQVNQPLLLLGIQQAVIKAAVTDGERRKRELRVRWERERTAPEQTVLPPRVAFIIRDPDDIRPARDIPAKEIEEVNNRFWLRDSLPTECQLQETFEIGFKLRCWHDLFASESDWIKWRDAHLTIPPDEVSLCILLWDHNEQIKNRLARKQREERK
jgi:hypothetical protein